MVVVPAGRLGYCRRCSWEDEDCKCGSDFNMFWDSGIRSAVR